MPAATAADSDAGASGRQRRRRRHCCRSSQACSCPSSCPCQCLPVACHRHSHHESSWLGSSSASAGLGLRDSPGLSAEAAAEAEEAREDSEAAAVTVTVAAAAATWMLPHEFGPPRDLSATSCLTSGILTTWTGPGFGKTVQTCLNHVQTCLSLYRDRNVKPVYTWYVHVYTMYIQICICTYVSVQICNSCPFHVHRQEFTSWYMYVHGADMSVHLPILNTDLTASSL